MLLEVRQETEIHFLVGSVILGFLSIFKNCQASSPYEALNSVCLSRVQRDVRPPVQMRWAQMAFFRVYTGDSDMPSFCEMKDEPEFKPLQWNQALFRVRASEGQFHLRQKTQGPSHIPTAEGKLLLRYLRKVHSPLQSKTGNQLSSWDNMGCMELSSSSCTEVNIHIDLRLLFKLISVVRSSKSRLLTCLLGNKALLCMQCRGIGPHLSASGKFHGFSPVAVGTWGTFSSYGIVSH